MIPNKALRAISATLIGTVGFLLIAFPLFVKPEVVARESLHPSRKFRQARPVKRSAGYANNMPLPWMTCANQSWIITWKRRKKRNSFI